MRLVFGSLMSLLDLNLILIYKTPYHGKSLIDRFAPYDLFIIHKLFSYHRYPFDQAYAINSKEYSCVDTIDEFIEELDRIENLRKRLGKKKNALGFSILFEFKKKSKKITEEEEKRSQKNE